ncbi:hypothetical protein HDU96_001436 [Phlyctochytrium bullatum]|nr:hypothetical protein HDU96_001436 [Phlyctochytrium bullatum]
MQIGSLPNLQVLYLPSNGLRGTIPIELGKLQNLQELTEMRSVDDCDDFYSGSAGLPRRVAGIIGGALLLLAVVTGIVIFITARRRNLRKPAATVEAPVERTTLTPKRQHPTPEPQAAVQPPPVTVVSEKPMASLFRNVTVSSTATLADTPNPPPTPPSGFSTPQFRDPASFSRAVSPLTAAQLSEKLMSMGVGPALAAALEDVGVDGAALSALDDEALRACGIELKASRTIVLRAVRQLLEDAKQDEEREAEEDELPGYA